jgi:signal transduction histidine kinase
MHGGTRNQPACPEEEGKRALAFAHQLLSGAEGSLDRLLAELAQAFGASGAGLAGGPAGTIVARASSPRAWPAQWPWQERLEVLAQLRQAPSAVTLSVAEGGSLLATSAGPGDPNGWFLWLEDPDGRTWTRTEGATLTLAAQALARGATSGVEAPEWARQLEHDARQRRLEETAQTIRGLAHDFSNIITGIVGFAELAQSRLENPAALKRHLAEVLQAGQQGVKAVQQLQLFTRRNKVNPGSCSLSTLVNEDGSWIGQHLGPVGRRTVVPRDLPAVAIEATALRQLVSCLLDNARTAMRNEGEVSLTARATQLTAADCLDLFGSPTPGPVVELLVSDTGSGLRAEVRQRIFAEPFFSTRPGHRGMGLAVVYGIVQAYHGGFRLDPNPEGQGTIARVVLPLAAAPARSSIPRKRPVPSEAIDDSPRRSAPQTP